MLAAVTMGVCSTSTLNDVAYLVLKSIRDKSYDCLAKNIIHPEVNFENGNISPAVEESLDFKREGGLSYREIAKSNVFLYFSKKSGEYTVDYIMSDKRGEFIKNKRHFYKKEYMKSYFTCSFVFKNGKWMLTEDFCHTEGDY